MFTSTCLVSILSLALPGGQGEDTKPSGDSGTTTSVEETSNPVELPADLRTALDEVTALREENELERARVRLRAIVESETYARLLAGEDGVALAGLDALDESAAGLSVLEIQRTVQEERFGRLSESLDSDHPELVDAAEKLAATRYKQGDLEGARALFDHVHAARERLLPLDHPDLLGAKLNLASTRYALGDLEGAHELFEQVHAARERLLPADHPHLLAAKQNLAATSSALGNLEGAHELFEQVHAAQERLLSPDHPDLLRAKHNLAITRRALGDLEGALALAEAVHTARERILPADHPHLLSAKQNLATTRKALGDLEGAVALEEAVLAAQERLLPPDHPHLLTAQQNLANTRSALGDLEGALALEEVVLAAQERLLPPDHPNFLVAKQNLANTRFALGDLEGALALFEHVHAANERLLPPDHPRLLAAKLNVAVARSALGDVEGARALAEAVHTARERLLPPDHPDLLATKQDLAITHKLLGDLEGALTLEIAVHAAWERLLPPDHPDLLVAKLNLANTRRALGDLEGALALEEAVYAARERLLPPDHPDLLATEQNLAKTRAAVGDFEGALALARSLLSNQLGLAAALRSESPRVARASALRELQRLPDALFLSAASEDGTDPLADPVFGVLETLRLASTGSSEVALAVSRAPELEPIRDRLARTRRQLNDLGLAPPEDEEALAPWREELLKLSDERDALERELRRALETQGVFTETPTVERVARALSEESALVSFLRYQRYFDEDPATGEAPEPLDSMLALVVRPDAPVRRVELGACAELEQLAGEWRDLLGKPIERGVAVEASEDAEAAAGRALRERIVDPCLTVLEEPPRTVHLILDDLLHLVPVDALPAADGNRLGEVLDVRIETSTRRLLAPARPVAGEGTLVAIGGVDFNASEVAVPGTELALATPPTERSSDRGAPNAFERLIQSRYEAETLVGLYEELLRGDPVLLTRKKATKAALHELAPEARFLHIATHGWFAPETFKSMIDSAEDTSARDELTRADRTLRGFAPETLCGLAFAGANHGANELGKVPGIMTAEELATLDLSNCELAVLSACETNVGIRRAGQGIQSLKSALHAAGARTAITSLWRVDDAATRRLMELFYTKLWGDGLGKADALWQAKMALREEGHPVRDWAAWVLTGDPD